MMARTAGARPSLLVPRARPGRAVDVATREAFIASQRHPARRRRRLRRVRRVLGTVAGLGLGLAALGVVMAVVAHALRTTPLLGVRQVEVVGARRVPEAVVLAAAAIAPDANLLALDVEGIVDRVEALPDVHRARVVRELPSRVTVVIEERAPYALVNGGDAAGRLLWVDVDGYLAGRDPHPAPPSLPILSGVERPADGPDHPVGDRLHAGLALLRAVQRVGGRVAGRISEIDLARPGGPVLYTIDGIEVWVGSEGWDERLARLDGVLGELDDRGERVESVDLRFRDLVVLSPRASTSRGKRKGH
ncbi:MAG: FtsQ-type POTRA domain-containing protein [Candidatus Rokubacteria bacterium]|nr:FtsQ-type POTRA domain-containing protein [Candidatus Rokubacteria bacterium]